MKSLFNNYHIKTILTSIVAILMSSMSWGQTFVWQIAPSEYTQIQGLGTGLLRVYKGSRFGIVRTDGTEVVPVEFDEMTGFYDHKSLLLKTEGGKQRIGGYLTDTGDYVPFQQAFFVLKGQAFYSDGMLSVADERGRLGYVNESGVAVVGFDGKYTKIKPYTEGHATVFEGKRYHLIDKDGYQAKFIIGFGEVQGGTNVCMGAATIWDTDGKFYRYNTHTRECVSVSKQRDLQLDYLYCFSSLSGRKKEIPYTQLSSGTFESVFSKMQNGKFGVQVDGHQVLPGQFSNVTPVSDELYVVTVGEKQGLLRVDRGGAPFRLEIPKTEIAYKAGGSAMCRIQFIQPGIWQSKAVELAVMDLLTGQIQEGTWKDGIYSFAVRPQGPEQTFVVKARSEELLLLDEPVTFTFKRQDTSLKVSISINGEIANKDDQVPVTAVITNPSDEAVTTTVHMTGSETFVEKHATVTIAAGGTERVHSYFHVTKDVNNQSVHVTTSKGGSSSRTGLKFESYY